MQGVAVVVWVAVEELRLTIIPKPYYLLYIHNMVASYKFLNSNPVVGSALKFGGSKLRAPLNSSCLAKGELLTLVSGSPSSGLLYPVWDMGRIPVWLQQGIGDQTKGQLKVLRSRLSHGTMAILQAPLRDRGAVARAPTRPVSAGSLLHKNPGRM